MFISVSELTWLPEPSACSDEILDCLFLFLAIHSSYLALPVLVFLPLFSLLSSLTIASVSFTGLGLSIMFSLVIGVLLSIASSILFRVSNFILGSSMMFFGVILSFNCLIACKVCSSGGIFSA